jgi:hypothetical protein
MFQILYCARTMKLILTNKINIARKNKRKERPSNIFNIKLVFKRCYNKFH